MLHKENFDELVCQTRYVFYVSYADNLGRRLVDLWICYELLSSYL